MKEPLKVKQIRDELEYFLVGWNLSTDRELKIVEDSNNFVHKFRFTYVKASFVNEHYFVFVYCENEDRIYLKCTSKIGDENIDWLKGRFEFNEKYSPYTKFYFSIDLNDIYNILVKIRPDIEEINRRFMMSLY